MLNPFKKNKKKLEAQRKQKELLEDYEKGKILQIDNGKNNKEYFKSIENGKSE
jgi:hypothetical protein